MLLILILHASLYAYTHSGSRVFPIDYLGSISSIMSISSKTRGWRFGSALLKIYTSSALKIVVPSVCAKNTHAGVTGDAAEKGKCQPPRAAAGTRRHHSGFGRVE